MKFQPTCSICLSKIKIVDLRIGSRRMGPGRKLLCKHVFHASCIDSIYKPQCPLCEHPIFNADEEALLTCTSEEAVVDILKTLHERDINVKNVFTFLTTHPSAKKHQWVVDLMYKYCDFTELLADNLGDKALVKEIVKRGKVNWFKTFCGGLTFFDLVYERTDDPEIISLVHAKLPMDPQNIPQIIRPGAGRSISRPTSFTGPSDNTVDITSINTSSVKSPEHHQQPPPVPPRTYQRHSRMDSMSGAALEQRLWGTTGPLNPNMERTATIRRSLMGSRSMYPSLMTHNEEPMYEQLRQPEQSEQQTYPIYEKLYPAVPSAPPIELI